MTRLARCTAFLAVVGVLSLAAAPAQAIPLTFNVRWSGISFGNGATATGFIVLESTLLPNPGLTSNYAAVLDANITVAGASSGNGTFTRPDFVFWVWSTDAVLLNLSEELVGQPVVGGTWGTSGGCCGDLNLFRTNPLAPSGTLQFRLTTAGGQDMLLTSMRQSVPEPSTAILLGVGALGLFSIIRRKLHA